MEDLIASLQQQALPPREVIIVDGAAATDRRTQEAIERIVSAGTDFAVRYVQSSPGTAVQRNVGIDLAEGELIAFIDDDVRLEPEFFSVIAGLFDEDDRLGSSEPGRLPLGGIVGYRTNLWLDPEKTPRWRWYRRLRLLQTFEPGAYDWATGFPINANLQPPFSGVRSVDFMTTACAVWRREVFEDGLRFDLFFRDYGVLEDAHLALRAGRSWRLAQAGDARCEELRAPGGRVAARRIAYKAVVNYWYVFNSVAGPLSAAQRFRFWRMQAFEVLRLVPYLLRHPSRRTLEDIVGRLEGAVAVARGAASPANQAS